MKQILGRILLKQAIIEIDRLECPSKQIIQKSFSEFTQETRVDIPQEEKSDQPLRSPELKRSIILLFSTYFKVTQNRIKHSATIAHLKLKSNFYEVNSSRHYKCKGLFTEEFQSILELQNHQIPKVKTALANHCNNNWRYLSDSRQSSTTLSTQ